MPRRYLLLLLSLILTFSAVAREHAAAPAFTLPTATGTVSLAGLRGKVVLVDFWASWCGPCRQSFPWLASMHERYSAQGLVIVAVNLDRNREAAQAFLEELHPPFAVAFDPNGKTAEAFRVEAMPSTFIVNRSGTIVRVHEGFEQAKARAFEDQIKEALSQ